MSVWDNLRRRSAGEDQRKEDFTALYNSDPGTVLSEEEYRGVPYKIYSEGSFPYIRVFYSHIYFSVYAKQKKIKVTLDDGEEFVLEKSAAGENFRYCFDKEGDYITGKHNGKKYTVGMIKKLAEGIIDKMIQEEFKFVESIFEK